VWSRGTSVAVAARVTFAAVTRTFLVASTTLGLLACGDDGRATSATAATSITTQSSPGATDTPTSDTPTDPGTGGDTSSASTVDVTGSASAPPDDSTGVVKFDIGSADTGGTTGSKVGCDKVDFLFVIDNSASMEDNQAALIQSFPGFITAIQSTLSATSDYHIMVVDTDDDGRCKQRCDMVGDPDVPEYCAEKNYHACNANLSECDTTRGAGVIHPVGSFATNMKCPIAGGNRYMLQDEPDLPTTFACVAKVGTAGNPSERPMNGMTEALSAPLNDVGGCNAGFLRDDAILVITFISDDPNYEDEGVPQEWYDAVVAAKKGNVQSIVVAGLTLVPEDPDCAGNGDIKGAHWNEFIDMWGDHGLKSTICAADYAPFFTEAVAIIDDACDNFVPPN